MGDMKRTKPLRKETHDLLKSCEKVADVMRSLSHPVRLKILCRLLENASGEAGVNELTEFCGTSQSGMSQFLKRMSQEKLLTSRREGHFVLYRIADQNLVSFLKAVREVYCT